MKSANVLLCLGLAACSSSPSLTLDRFAIELERPCAVALDADPRPVARVDLGVGEPLRFLLDSGSTISLIAGHRVDALGLERRPHASAFDLTGSGGRSVEVDDYVLFERLELGTLVMREPRISVLDGPALAQAGVDGVIGQDVLARIVLVIDMQRDVAHILPQGGPKAIASCLDMLDLGRGNRVSVPLELRPCPFVSIEVAGIGQHCVLEIDTGAGTTTIPGSVLDSLGLRSIGLRMSGGVDGNYTEKLYRLEDFELFGQRVSLDVSATSEEEGLLGMDVLGERIVVLDGPDRTLWLIDRD